MSGGEAREGRFLRVGLAGWARPEGRSGRILCRERGRRVVGCGEAGRARFAWADDRHGALDDRGGKAAVLGRRRRGGELSLDRGILLGQNVIVVVVLQHAADDLLDVERQRLVLLFHRAQLGLKAAVVVALAFRGLQLLCQRA